MGSKIRLSVIVLFVVLLAVFSVVSAFVAYFLCSHFPFPLEINYLLIPLFFLIFLFPLFLIANRVVTMCAPLPEGIIQQGTKEEAVLHFLALLNVTIFYVPVHSHLVIPPLTDSLYRLLGAKIGTNSYPGVARICWPFEFFSCGDNVVFGEMAIITPHVLEKNQLAIYRIKLGSNITIGAQSIIMAGVVVGDNAVIAAGAVVPKFTIIGPGETWGGVPAKKIEA